MKIFAQRSLRRNGVELFIGEQIAGHILRAAAPVTLTMERIEPGYPQEPTLVLPMDAGQQLMQELWDQGFRPNNGAGSSSEADALRQHIAFAELVATTLLPKR